MVIFRFLYKSQVLFSPPYRYMLTLSHVFLWVSDYDQQRNIPLASRNFKSHSVVSYIIIIVISRDWLFHYPGFQNENNNDGD